MEVDNGVARKLKKLRTQRETTGTSRDYLSIASFYIMGTSLKRKELALRGSEFIPLRVVPYGMEITFTLNVYYFHYARA